MKTFIDYLDDLHAVVLYLKRLTNYAEVQEHGCKEGTHVDWAPHICGFSDMGDHIIGPRP